MASSIPIPGGRSFHPVKIRRKEKVLIRLYIKTSPLFALVNYTLYKTPPFLLFPHFSICTLNKTFSLEGEEAQNRGGKFESEIGGNLSLSPKLGESCTQF